MSKFTIAKILSVLFNPVFFILLITYIIVFRQTEIISEAVFWTLFSFLFVFLGIFIIWQGVKKGEYTDTDLSNKEQRSHFYVIALFLALIHFIALIFLKGINFHLTTAALGILIGVIVFMVVNRSFKLSIHLAATCGFITTVSVFYGLGGLLATAWIIPVISWSRLLLKKHTPREVFLGIFFGTFITLITFLIGRQFV